MNKKYHIIEIDQRGNETLWVKVLTGRAAYDMLAQLKTRFPNKRLVIQVEE